MLSRRGHRDRPVPLQPVRSPMTLHLIAETDIVLSAVEKRLLVNRFVLFEEWRLVYDLSQVVLARRPLL